MRKLIFAVLMTVLLTPSLVLAQDDSAFAKIYRTIREMTDSLKTYSFYLAPPSGSFAQIKPGNSHQKKLLSVFHFLKTRKNISYENPDFAITIKVENQRLLDPGGGNGPGMVTRSSNGDGYTETAFFTFTFAILVHTKNRQSIRYQFYHPVVVRRSIYERPQHSFFDIQRDSLSRHGYSLSGTTQHSSFIKMDLLPTMEDYKYELSKLLDRYKNRYVDRVDN